MSQPPTYLTVVLTDDLSPADLMALKSALDRMHGVALVREGPVDTDRVLRAQVRAARVEMAQRLTKAMLGNGYQIEIANEPE